jgi:hypothetical protein
MVGNGIVDYFLNRIAVGWQLISLPQARNRVFLKAFHSTGGFKTRPYISTTETRFLGYLG